MEAICDFCKNKFFTLPSWFKRNKRHYCSRSCQRNDFKNWSCIGTAGKSPWNKGLTIKDERVMKYALARLGKRNYPEIVCKYCNNNFKVLNYKKSRKFCSNICREEYQKKFPSVLGKRKYNRICPICNSNFKTSRNYKKTCSRKCGIQSSKKKHIGKKLPQQIKEKMSISHSGDKCHLWLGGKSFEPYNKEFNRRFKRLIKERDGCCMLCNIGFEDLRLLKRQVHIHHIDYNKLLSIPQNCISLCNSCHSRTNHHREYWTKFYQGILSERYGYEYSEEMLPILNLNNGEIRW